jgi:hypothetical protein
MKKEFIVARIEGSEDGSPFVYVTFNDPKDYKPSERQQNPFNPNATGFSSLDDFVKNMPKVMSNISGMMGGGGLTDAPTMKMSIMEYQDMGIKVGDKAVIEIQKSDHGRVQA